MVGRQHRSRAVRGTSGLEVQAVGGSSGLEVQAVGGTSGLVAAAAARGGAAVVPDMTAAHQLLAGSASCYRNQF